MLYHVFPRLLINVSKVIERTFCNTKKYVKLVIGVFLIFFSLKIIEVYVAHVFAGFNRAVMLQTRLSIIGGKLKTFYFEDVNVFLFSYNIVQYLKRLYKYSVLLSVFCCLIRFLTWSLSFVHCRKAKHLSSRLDNWSSNIGCNGSGNKILKNKPK